MADWEDRRNEGGKPPRIPSAKAGYRFDKRDVTVQPPGRNYDRGHASMDDLPGNGKPHLVRRPEIKQPGNFLPHEMFPEGPEWVANLQMLWAKDKKKSVATIATYLSQIFDTVENPFLAAIYLTETPADYFPGRWNSLSTMVMNAFENWIRPKKDQYKHYLTEEIQRMAFALANRNGLVLLKFVVQAFELKNCAFSCEDIEDMLNRKMYKEASLVITALDLQRYFNLREVALPLILQDRAPLAEAYVRDYKDLQVSFVSILDELCAKTVNFDDIIREMDVPVACVQRQKVNRKGLNKLASKLIKLFNIPIESCPNICHMRNLGSLKYALYKHYVEGSMTKENLQEMIEESVGENPLLHEELITLLVGFGDSARAAWWARRLRVPHDTLPSSVRLATKELGEWCDGADDDGAARDATDTRYLQLKLSLESVYYIDTVEQLRQAVEFLSQHATVVGLDAEWKPSIGTKKERMSLLQIATRDKCFLLDLVALPDTTTDSDWEDFVKRIFCNEKILKLGFAFDTDLSMLSKSFPSTKEHLMGMRRVVDIFTLNNELKKACPDLHVNSHTPAGDGVSVQYRGLSELVYQCLGRPLDKREQYSNWERRPLRKSQLVYAVLDACCLLEVYDVLIARAQQRNLDVDLEPAISSGWATKRTKIEKNQAKLKEYGSIPKEYMIALDPHRAAVRAHDFRVVVDTMLQGLGRQLRRCGVDVCILNNNDYHDVAAKIAQAEGRVVLTMGEPYQSLRNHVGEGMCMSVTPGPLQEQVVQVLRQYNVTLTPEDIFSRCQVCNGGEYVHIPGDVMRRLWQRKMQLLAAGEHAANEEPEYTGKFARKLRRAVHVNTHDGDRADDVGRHGDDRGAAVEDGGEASGGSMMALDGHTIDCDAVTVNGAVSLKVAAVPQGIVDKVGLFDCCVTCGKVYWDGSHFGKVCAQFADALELTK
ncbi:PREDICTED: exonuclease mut-7 homolog [Priapulus caudatus]|uniref:Exonuclease mut-7 homolog n=1 Tax=Priapulus caudatus TaxID=37621 RepID=A0ABM1F9W2_PRICU|nr:PREDICTED: exonuclease mut-7 homolog [Priapulus caudatus]XP_014681234.1 PREDICTED: exonuclease mut-7 homolog [Priapulus caudatus]